MANTTQPFIDPNNGFCPDTKTFHSLRPSIPLPPLSQPLSITRYALSQLTSSSTFSPSTPFLIDSVTGHRLSYSHLISHSQSLSSSLRAAFPNLSKGDVALVVSPPSLDVPVLYFSLLSLGVIVSPVNPLSTVAELTHFVQLSNPKIVFATSSTSPKLSSLNVPTVLLDSPRFTNMMRTSPDAGFQYDSLSQLDSAAILYSSGTTGRVKGVELTHRNLIAVVASLVNNRFSKDGTAPADNTVSLFPLPLFHVFGFFMLIRAATIGETLVLMNRFDFEKMLKAVEEHRVTYMPVSPPLIVAMAKSELVTKYDLSSLELLACGGAPLGKEVSQSFTARFPHVHIAQGYGMTETGGAATNMTAPDECERYGSAGRLISNVEAKIVDPVTNEALSFGQRGELWLRGPLIMKGYVGNTEATTETMDSGGWLKTGDLCYFDSDGFLYIVDRLKELIKYKAYQVPPAELEHILQSIPEIADAAVIPYPDEEAGQIPMAYIVRKPGSNINEAQVMDIVARQVSPYKKIRRVAFVNSIPKSPAGKILRRELVNHALSGALSKL